MNQIKKMIALSLLLSSMMQATDHDEILVKIIGALAVTAAALTIYETYNCFKAPAEKISQTQDENKNNQQTVVKDETASEKELADAQIKKDDVQRKLAYQKARKAFEQQQKLAKQDAMILKIRDEEFCYSDAGFGSN